MKNTPKGAASTRPRRMTAMETRQAATTVRWPTENEIRVRAYAIYQQNACVPGQERDDWLQAERELLSKYGS